MGNRTAASQRVEPHDPETFFQAGLVETGAWGIAANSSTKKGADVVSGGDIVSGLTSPEPKWQFSSLTEVSRTPQLALRQIVKLQAAGKKVFYSLKTQTMRSSSFQSDSHLNLMCI